MAEYIEKQAIIMALETQWNGMVLDVFDVIRNLPSEDVQTVIRCKDCKWFNNIGCAINIVDESDKPHEDDFCSFGERKDGEQNG